MAYTNGYTNDIFISYSHVDNIRFPGEAEGWIEQFYQGLEVLLAQRFGRMGKVNVWWDKNNLDGSVLFNPSIETGIKKSAIIICLNSKGYQESAYCNQELSTFYEKARQEKIGLSVGDRSRILNVLLYNIPHEEWPTPMKGTVGFSFHNAKSPEKLGYPIKTSSDEFKEKMRELMDAICEILKDFSKDTETEEADTKDDFTIFVGEVADTLRTPRKRLIAELEKQQYKIVYGVPPPDEAAPHDAATRKALVKADLAIHLFDQIAGREIIDQPNTWYPQKQAEISLGLEVPKLIWVPSGLKADEVEEDPYRAFLQQLENNNDPENRFEFIRGIPGELARQVMNYAEAVKQSRSRVTNNEKISVLLDTHVRDQQYAFTLGQALLQNDIEPFVNPQEADPLKNINLLSERISQVNKLVFLYGNADKEWLQQRVNSAMQFVVSNNYPISDFYVYLAPPYKKQLDITTQQRFFKLNVLNNSTQPDLKGEMLNTFIHFMKGGNAA